MANVKLSEIASGGALVVATDSVVTVRNGTTDVLTTLGTLAAQSGTFSGTSSGTNTGDVTLAGETYISIAGQVITASAVNLSGTNVTGTLAAARFPALTGDITTSAGSVATSLKSTGTAGTYGQVTTDAQGRVTSGTTNDVAHGGTGVTSLTAYAVICGGTTSTGIVQSIASVGNSGQVLTSNGAGALPTFQAAGAGGTNLGVVYAIASGNLFF